MKRKILLLLILLISNFCTAIKAQTNQWTWIKGDDIGNQNGVYGTKGVASPINKPGGREPSVCWIDASSNFWLFGGSGYTATSFGQLNDLWKYSPTTNEWTWISGDNTINQTSVYGTQGVAAPTNKPGARNYSVSWTDASGNLWLFGGYVNAATPLGGQLNDLWKYNPNVNEWTWIKGDNITNQSGVYGTRGVAASSNKPGARQNSITWTDASGNLWLFGGVYNDGAFVGRFNDLWKYDPNINEWTWISGDNIVNQASEYGTQGNPAPTNKPGARHGSVSWADASGNLWLWGGFGYTVTSTGNFNDLWKFNINTTEWTWLSGDNTINQIGVYGTQGIASPTNKPGARYGSASWTDASGSLWLLGGFGYAASGLNGHLNDLWKYNTATNQWTWVSGDNMINQTGVYGTQGIPATTNKPGARGAAASRSDAPNNFWLFGGDGFEATSRGLLNDLWKFTTSNCNTPSTWYVDADADGFGNAAVSILACNAPTGYVNDNTDCNDANNTIHPGATEICNAVDDDCDGLIDEHNGSVSVGTDEWLYFGYAPDQCVLKTAIAGNGTPPYSYHWTLDRPLLYNVITPDGDESMADINTQTVTVCLLDTAKLCVTVTDAQGCTFTGCATIFASDVRCFAGNSGNQKVKVCHNGNTICIDSSTASAHLAHEDYVGPCLASRANPGDVEIEGSSKPVFSFYPNPNNGNFIATLNIPDDEIKHGVIQVINISGKAIKQIKVNEQHQLNISLNETGVYFIRLITNKQILTKKVTVIR